MSSAPEAHLYKARTPIKVAPDAPSLAIGIPTRGTASFEFFISLLQMLPPLNVKLAYCIQPGKLPAAARNSIIEKCLGGEIQYVFFLDDDVLFPDVTLYRLWVHMQKHPEAACITGIVPTKIEPTEPLLYSGEGNGSDWDWPLGALKPIASAGAGCMIVNLNYVKLLTPPYFDDIVVDQTDDARFVKRNTTGHDRYFLERLTSEAGGIVYADTGLLLAHWDAAIRKPYLLPPDSPCFQRAPMGEAYVPLLTTEGAVYWKRIVPTVQDGDFIGYLDWLKTSGPETTSSTVRSSDFSK